MQGVAGVCLCLGVEMFQQCWLFDRFHIFSVHVFRTAGASPEQVGVPLSSARSLAASMALTNAFSSARRAR